MKLTDQYKGVTMDLVQRVLKLEKWRRDKTGDSPLFDIANEHTPATLSANQNDYDPGFYDVLRIDATLALSITGITRGQKGRFLELCNISSFNITLPYESTSSVAANRIINSSGEDIRLFPTGRVRLYYDSTLARWVISDPPSWKGKYGMATRLYLASASSTQTISTGAGGEKILLDSIVATIGDPYGFFDAGNNRIVIPTGMDGFYMGGVMGTWASHVTADTRRLLAYQHNGVERGITVPAVANAQMRALCPISLVCAAGDIIDFYAYQESGGDLDLSFIYVDFARIR